MIIKAIIKWMIKKNFICAWCWYHKLLKSASIKYNITISHGMCKRHAEKMKKGLADKNYE